MKTVILAGGFGTRISEESHLKPKPMIEIGDMPILWHIMKGYSAQGFHDFVICCGYKQHVIKEFFANYYLYRSDVTFHLCGENSMEVHNNAVEPWQVTVVDTGFETMTGGRIKRVQRYLDNQPFMLTYGDGVSDVDLHQLLDFHQKHRKIATLTAVNVGQRFGLLEIGAGGRITAFREKNDVDGEMINGGFMVLEPEIFDYLEDDTTIFEREPLEQLAREDQLMAYQHSGFWHCMDTARDRAQLEAMWASGEAPWKRWDDR